MKKLISAAILSLAAILVALQPATAFDPNNKAELEKFIHDYIVAHPEVLLEAQDALQAKQQAARRTHDKKIIAANKKKIFDAAGDLVLGNPKGDVTVVELFDYNCPYCKHAVQDMKALIAGDPGVRFVLKEFPILGQDSVAASRVSIAFQMVAPDKFKQFHNELMSSRTRASGESAFKIAAALGVSKETLKEKLAEPAVDARIKQTYRLANELNLTGTPSYIVGDEAMSGAVGADTLEQKVANMRKCNSTTC